MNQTRLSLMIILIGMPLVIVQAFAAQEGASQTAAAEAQQTYEEIEKTLGAVPSFIRHFPEEGGGSHRLGGIEVCPTQSRDRHLG